MQVDGRCRQELPCTNKPEGPNSTYTSGARAPWRNCSWSCLAGFVNKSGVCVACNVSSFNASLHLWSRLGSCDFECLPQGYAPLNCTAKCVELDNTLERVRDLPLQNRSRYDVNPFNCTSTTSGRRYGYLLGYGKGGRCGDSVLNDGEECDDGNAQACFSSIFSYYSYIYFDGNSYSFS